MAKASDAPTSQNPNQTQRATEETARAARRAPDRTAEAARTATQAGAEATRPGAAKPQGQMDTMLDPTSRVPKEAAGGRSKNLELMKRLAKTMMAGAREPSWKMVDWTRQAAERQAE